MSWLDKLKEKTLLGKMAPVVQEPTLECKVCKEELPLIDVAENLYVCPKCDHHFRMGVLDRIHMLVNHDTFIEQDQNLRSLDPIKFKDKKKYRDRIKSSLKLGIGSESIICGTSRIGDHSVELCVFNFKFLGGSMGSVVGEKIVRAIERAIQNKSSLVIVSCSGGARMQEGILSLMQMGKTAAALAQLSEHGLPYISILTDPTTGGVSASFAMLGDVILAEPGALIGFAGPRVIQQTINQKLPEGFQTSEFLMDHGLIDQVVHRKDLRSTVENFLSHMNNSPIKDHDKEPDSLSSSS